MQMPAGSALGLSADTKITYSVTGLGNPEWGLSRGQPASNFTWNFDINDSVVFTQYDLWTNQIDVKITDSNT